MITAHDEGANLNRAIESSFQIISDLADSASVTVFITLDVSDEITDSFAEQAGFPILRTEYGDVGEVRNLILSDYSSQYDATLFLDGDDECDSTWVQEALKSKFLSDKPMLASPSRRELVYEQSSRRLTFCQPSATATLGCWLIVNSVTNLWHSCVLINNTASSMIRYPLEKDGVLFEDWRMNNNALQMGIPHLSYPGLVKYHRKKNSRLKTQQLDHRNASTLYERFINFVRKVLALAVLSLMARPNR